MSQPAQLLAARYQLRLGQAWQAWFDEEAGQIRLPGGFRAALSADRLTCDAPAEIWPGFMLPDTLPLITNDYGDWICVRVGSDDHLGELLHWYHGGGDWIPLGTCLAEMVVHDAVDQLRPIGRQMLRGAPESLGPKNSSQALESFEDEHLRRWLVTRLYESSHGDALQTTAAIETALNAIRHCLAEGDYAGCLHRLQQTGWARDAVACDLIQWSIQQPLGPLAESTISRQLAVAWTPDYVRWLFDAQLVPHEHRQQILQLAAVSLDAWPEQDWETAERVAREVLQRRHDLGWAANIAGWCRQRAGDVAEAISFYFTGRLASAFSDQAVRMRTHWSDGRFGKFTVAQLWNLKEFWSDEQHQDEYLHVIGGASAKLTTRAVREYWLQSAHEHLSHDEPAEAYSKFFRAGWDLGVEQITEYVPILDGLFRCAQAAGWAARAAVAHTHLQCLKQRLKR